MLYHDLFPILVVAAFLNMLVASAFGIMGVFGEPSLLDSIFTYLPFFLMAAAIVCLAWYGKKSKRKGIFFIPLFISVAVAVPELFLVWVLFSEYAGVFAGVIFLSSVLFLLYLLFRFYFTGSQSLPPERNTKD